jgi:hypothetical protein
MGCNPGGLEWIGVFSCRSADLKMQMGLAATAWNDSIFVFQ